MKILMRRRILWRLNLGLHCLVTPVCPNTYGKYGNYRYNSSSQNTAMGAAIAKTMLVLAPTFIYIYRQKCIIVVIIGIRRATSAVTAIVEAM